MPYRKPTLGYPTRTDAVLALRSQGLSRAEVGARIGISEGTVAALEFSGARRKHGTAGATGACRVEIGGGVADLLRSAAEARRVSVERLAADLLEAIACDDLIDAVLDDGGGSA